MLGKSFRERRAKLRDSLCATNGIIRFAESYDVDLTSNDEEKKKEDENNNNNTQDMEEVNQFLEQAVKNGTEGLMVKTLDVNASYEPSVRSLNWLKLKKDYVEGCGDSLDLVPIAAWSGKGKRTGVYGAYLLACYNAEDDQFQTICKVGTGFSDKQLKDLTEKLKNHIIPKPSNAYCYNREKLKPDVWFDTVTVWEVKAADLTISPAHMAAVGMAHESKGIALRFPRLERIRDDKTPEEATSAEQVFDMYQSQSLIE